MKLFTTNDFVIGDSGTIKSKRRLYAKRIATFDTETTSYYNADGDERATLYEWQLCIGNVDNTYFGRYYDTMREMFESIHEQNGENWQIIFVHNLGFDFVRSTLPSAIHLPTAHASVSEKKSSGKVG